MLYESRCLRAVAGLFAGMCLLVSCKPQVSLTVVDPGHFHAAMVLREDLPGVDRTVRVCAPDGEGLDAWTASVERFNSRTDSPTHWSVERIGTLAPAASSREVVVLSGDNQLKARHILDAVSLGYNVLSDKPMAISATDCELLDSAYALAAAKGLVIMDLMTERHDEVNMAARKALEGRIPRGGSPENPDIVMSSVHHFYKEVDGVPLRRPAWYYDVRHQGEGLADVTTHLIDLVMWQCFPGETIEPSDVEVICASHYPTPVTLGQFSASTGCDAFPDYLTDCVSDGVLQVCANGTMLLRIRDLYVSITVRWDFAGGPDTFSATYNCPDGPVQVLQDASTGYSRRLLDCRATAGDATSHPGAETLTPQSGVDITPAITLTHEDHFSLVMQDFLRYVRGARMPSRESANTLSKYHLTTSAVEMASRCASGCTPRHAAQPSCPSGTPTCHPDSSTCHSVRSPGSLPAE